MHRRITVAIVLGALVVSACSDQSQSPSEPPQSSASIKPALPRCSTQGWLTDIKSKNALVFTGALLSSANDKVTAIYNQCKRGAQADAKKKAIFFVDWLGKKYRAHQTKSSARAVDLANLTSAVLSGVGLQAGDISPATFGPTGGVGSFDNTQSAPTTVTTLNQNAGVQLPGTEGGTQVPAYGEATLIILIQLPDSPQLTGEGAPPSDQQFPPNYDINAINASGTHEFQAGAPDGVVSICLRPDIDYPDNVVIGHTTFAGVFEFLPPASPIAVVTCGTPIPTLGAALPPGLPGLALSAWRTATRYVGPLAQAIVLPQRLSAAVRTGVASGSARSLSPFGLVTPGDPAVSSPSVSAGDNHACGVNTAGRAFCWGYNGQGRLGDGTTTNTTGPVAVAGEHTFAAVSAGDFFTCGLAGGAAYCWGNNGSGDLGDSTNTDSNVPVAVAGGHSFAAVSADQHSCGVTISGSAFCWGYNGQGQLGDGTTTNSNVPVAVAGGHTFASVSTGNSNSCGVTTADLAYCWGSNPAGGLGDSTNTGSNVPVAVAGGHTFAAVSVGIEQSCGLTTTGTAYCWGWNEFGQLGDSTNTNSNVPVAVGGGHSFIAVSAGDYHTCGVTTTGAAYCWGQNFSGALGDGTNADSNVPQAVAGSHVFAALSAGATYTCGVTTAGEVYCWGANDLGQLGNGTTSNSNVPVAVSLP